MAAVDVILLSSPHRHSGSHVAALSSSPSFPSPRALLQNWPQMRSSNRAAPVQLNITKGLVNATSLRRNGLVDDGLSLGQSATGTTAEDSIWDLPGDTPLKLKTARKPRMVKGTVDQDKAGPRKLPKSRSKKTNTETGEEISKGKNASEEKAKRNPDEDEGVIPKKKPPRKPRSKKAVGEGQTKLPKGRVTKPSPTTQDEKLVRKKRIETVSHHFTSAVKDQEDAFEPSDHSCNNLQLQEAMKRRKGWTSPPPETQEVNRSSTPSLEDVFGTLEPSKSTDKQVNITDLLGGFRHERRLERDLPARVMDPVGSKKRKLIELVKTNASAQQNPATKVSAAKKKPRTITEKATSVYAVSNDQEVAPAQTPLSQYFSQTALTSKENGGNDRPKARSKNPTKTSAKAALSKKVTAQTAILLSPQSALHRVEGQAFVFGTCSQLAREESPTLLRNLHEAMQASNQIEDIPCKQIIYTTTTSESCTVDERGTGSYMAKRNLWAAASSGIDDWQKDIQIVDLSKSPVVMKNIYPAAMAPTGVDNLTTAREAEEDKRLSIDKDFEFGTTDNTKTSNGDHIFIDKRSRPSSSQGGLAIPEGQKNALNSSKEDSSIKMPDYASYPAAQLAREIASYRFKPVKNREQMIALLERCWEGKQMVARGAPGSTGHSTSTSMQSKQTMPNAEPSFPTEVPKTGGSKSRDVTKSTSLRRPVSRAKPKEPSFEVATMPLTLRLTPKKKPKAHQVEEIYDSDTPLTPSPPRHHPSQIPSPPLPLPLKPSSTARTSKQKLGNMSNTTAINISETSQSNKEDLHKAISMAITSAPRSRDTQTPSWHEKILLFDPIILEDLAEWLNSGELARIGWTKDLDGNEAVSPAEVKSWCLSKSICCLWRENLRGRARSRY